MNKQFYCFLHLIILESADRGTSKQAIKSVNLTAKTLYKLIVSKGSGPQSNVLIVSFGLIRIVYLTVSTAPLNKCSLLERFMDLC